MTRACTTALFVLASAVLTGCHSDSQNVRGAEQGDAHLPSANRLGAVADTTGLPPEGALAQVALGDLAGIGDNTLDAAVRNPYAGDMAAIKAGEETFVQMNCASCHGYALKGGMGPDLTDTYWRYGGAPADIYKSIFEGRPQGMPAWGRAISPAMIWKVVAYIESKGGAFPGRMADRARQGDLGNRNDDQLTSFSTLKGFNSAR